MRAREKMSRWWLLCLAVAVLSNGAFAQRVSRETAQSVAETFFNGNVRKGQTVHFADITAETPFQNFYIFSADSGFVIVAADERVTPILGYSKTNRFVTEDMPENLRWWLEGYDGQIQAARERTVSVTQEIVSAWNDLKAGNRMVAKGNRGKVLDLTTKWDQQNKTGENCVLYNNFCPPQAGPDHTLTGCTATAMAQVMKYWEWPITGSGSHSYTLDDFGEQFADFGATTYDWANMEEDILTCSSPQVAIDAVATLMYHCGVAANMQYSYTYSSAGFIPSSFVDYFDYSVAVEDAFQNNYSDEEWIAMLMHEIDYNRPVLYGGHYNSNGGSPGHAFICYGYDNNNMFKFNWGWSGAHDGEDEYWAVGALNPGLGGSGSGSGTYNLNCECLFHLMPTDRSLNAPSSLSVTNTTSNALQLSWTSAENALSYIILRNDRFLVETQQTSYLDEDIFSGSYSYQVLTVGGNHRASLPTGKVTYTNPFVSPSPTGLSASASGTSVELLWEAPSNSYIPIFHFRTPFEMEDLEAVSCESGISKCYEVFRPSDIRPYADRFITTVVYWISAREVGKEHTLKVSKGCFPNEDVLVTYHFIPNKVGSQTWHLTTPIRVDNDDDIVVEIEVANHSGVSMFDCVQGNDELLTSYINTGGTTVKMAAGKHFIIDLYMKWANELTYNVYRNDGHHLVCLARDLQQPSYTDDNLPTGLYTYYVTTNYYGGESEPSETVSIGYGNFTVVTTSSPMVGGTVTGNQGGYTAGTTVTLTATANAGFVFNGWMENGQVVCNTPTYTFQALANRNLSASFVSTEFAIGSLVTNPDGSQGVVFYVDPSGTEGWMVALNDASTGCQWGTTTNVPSLVELPVNSPIALSELSGYCNTGNLRAFQGEGSGYAAAQVDYANGWYLPSVGQLRKLYSALPFIESALTAAGGTTLSDGTYWSSTEFSASDASTPAFALGNTNKTSACRVRAIRNFVTAGNNVVIVASNYDYMGTALVSGNGTFTYGATVTVTATPNTGFAFNHWSEDGVVVSYDAEYQFAFARSCSLVANFSVPGRVGSIVSNADGSQGVVFWLSPDGDEGLMVALEDASYGCQWGSATDALTLLNKPFNQPIALQDVSGNTNTRCIRNHQGVENDYAASLVDFENGWYLPSVGELRKLYGALPIIEAALVNAGGSTLTEDTYWSSTEYSGSDAATATFSMGNTNKTNTCRVRAIRHFAAAGPNAITVKSNNLNFGTVAGSGEYSSGQYVTVTASPNPGYAFNTWTENGMIVSYDATYQFTFTRSRSLVANFVAQGSVGSIVTNADGSRGVIFYAFPSGVGGLMVALENTSSGCPWGLNEDITILDNQSPSAVMELLDDMSGKNNTNRIREWYSGNTEYAACKTDFAHGWYLPSAGQLRKLYSALPVIEEAIINAGGVMLTEDAYWSSTEQSADNAWTPSFAMSSSNKAGNYCVRAIRSVLGTEFIVANVNNVAGGTVAGDGEYDVGQTCTLKAQANESYAFLNWTCDRTVVSTDPEYTFTVMANQTFTANFVANSSNITTMMDPAGSGTVTGAGVYVIGSNCTLTATPHTGYTFMNWTKNGNVVCTQPTYSFTVTESGQYTAHFVLNSYTVTATVSPEEGGSVSGAHAYNHGSTATLTATPAEGYTFINWKENGVVVSTSPTYQFVVTGNRTLQANFSNNAYTVTAIAYPSDGGTIEGAGVYEYGTLATLTAVANFGYEFFCWFEDDDIVSFDPSMSFEVTEDVVVYAVFVEIPFVIQVTANPENGGIVNGGGTYNYGANCTLTATANTGYTFSNWTKDGTVVSTNPIYIFTVTEDASYVANFEAEVGLPGDANGDGIVNALDIVIIVNYIFGETPAEFVFENADINEDGVVNALDLVAIVNLIFSTKTNNSVEGFL